MAVAFALATVALGSAALGLALSPSPAVSAASAALLSATAIAYLVSRAGGIPLLGQHKEPFDTLGVATSVLEVTAAVVAWQSKPRRQS